MIRICLNRMRDEEGTNYVRASVMLQILLEDYDSLPAGDYAEACEKAINFIDMGMKDDGKRKPHTMDWERGRADHYTGDQPGAGM